MSTAAEEQLESSREAAARASRLLRSRELTATAQSVIITTLYVAQWGYVTTFLPFQGMMKNLGESVVQSGQGFVLRSINMSSLDASQ